MKRLTSFLLAFALLLSMLPTAFAAEGTESRSPTPDKIGSTTVWSYLDDGSDPAGTPGSESYNRTSWTAVGFDDSAWKTASGSFGAKNDGTSDGADYKLDGCNGSSNYPTYYFRTKVNVSDDNAVTKITGTIAFDDAVIVYINGEKAFSYNDAGVDTNSSYCTNKSANKQTESFEITDSAVLNNLVPGTNVIAVELHNQAANSSDIWFAMPDMTFSTEPLPVETQLLNGEAQWTYLDNNTDPAAGSDDRTSWTAEDFSTDGWKTAAGPFGSKRGGTAYDNTHTATTVLEGCDASNDTPAYFFRTTFRVTSLEGMTKLNGTLEYDDGVIVYINGQRVAAGHDIACDPDTGNSLGHGFDANLQYGGSNQGPDTLNFSLIDLSILHPGTNTIAVELHNGRKTSSDVWFHLSDLSLSDEEVEYQSNVSLSMGADQSQMNFTWYSPLADAQLLVADNGAMTDATPITATATVANDGQYSCKATAANLTAGTTYYYQLCNKNNKSDVYSFRTDNGGDFSFAFVGDPQIGASNNTASDAAGWENTLNIIGTNDIFSDVSFLMSAGDQVNAAADEAQYDSYLDHDVLTGLPVATAIGNHDSGSNAYSQHFNVPNESDADYGKTAAGGDYYFVYNNALFMVLNSNAQSTEDVAAHKAFMEQAIATAGENIQWKIVMFHHTLFTVASHAHDGYIDNENGFKAQIIPVLQELDVDVVLQGHDHVYCRTYMMDVTTPITQSEKYEYDNGAEQAPTAVNDPTGILYVTANSGSGSKTYGIRNETFNFSAVQNQDNKANVSKVTVSDKQFTITTYRTSDMTVVDSFTIDRTVEEEEGYKVTFAADGHATVDVYDTQDYTTPSGTNVTTAYARNSDTGAIDMSGDGQVNFRVTADEGYALASVTAKGSYKNLKVDVGSDAGVDGVYRLTKIDGPVTVTIATQPTGSTEPEEPTYTPVVTGDTRVTGYYNETGSLKLELAGRYNSGAMNADGGSLEIVQYNPANGFAYAVSGVKGKLIAVNLNGELSGDTVVNLCGAEYDLKSTVSADGFTYGDMTSVAISPDGTKLAVAIQAENYADSGVVALFACNSDGSLELLSTVSVGAQPDMVTFADNNTILTADEGEPRNGVNGVDPKGSVSIVTIDENNSLSANSVYFDSFDATRDSLTAAGVLVQKNTQPSTDFEPEYIAVSGNTAYVSLQEANAIAVLNIADSEFTGVYPLGFQNYGESMADLQKNDMIELNNYPNVYGIKMPDGISVTSIGGKTYLLTANEGDSRADWDGLNNELEGKTSPTGNVTLDKKVVWFNANLWDGLDTDKAYVFGGRSFSIYEVTTTGLNLVYDSGSDFETITAEQLPDYFNASNDKTSLDNRSGKKGPEPETVVTGTVDGKTYAFVALERIGGIMVYDITNPAYATFVNYINSREFDDAIKGDVSPEGLCFIPASKTGKTLLLAACEVSGTLAAYELTAARTQPEQDGLKIAVISDDHLYDASELGSTGAAFNAYLASDRKLLAESEAILDEALAKIANSGAQYLLIPGDLTKDGEKVNHELLAQKLKTLEDETDIEVFVINGNHDISNAHAVRFTGDTTEPVETVNTDEFRSIYNDFGYGQAVAKDTGSLSYAVDLGTDYRLIVMDACIYNNDKTNPSQQTGGEFSEGTLNWVLGQIKAAVQAGRRPIGMMHHGLVPHTAVQPVMFSEYLVKDYQTVAATLADAGMNVVFTGHFHSQDVSSVTTDKGNVLYDVETGSLVTSPCPIRYVTLEKNSFSYTTDHVTYVQGYPNFQQHAANFLQTGMTGLVSALLPYALRALGVTDETQITALCQKDALKALLVGGFIAHYAGDETIDGGTAAGLAQLAEINGTLAQLVRSLYTDSTPADCEASALTLSALPTYPSDDDPSDNGSSGGSFSGGSSSGTSTTTEKNPDGSTTTTTVNKATGTVTEVTKNPDGSTSTVETKKDGTVTETNKTADGSTGTVVTDKNGNITQVNANVSSAAVEEAAKTGKIVTLPVEVPAAKSAKDAPAVAVTVPQSAGSVKVEIPVEKVTSGTVAVIVKADGTEEIVSTSIPTEIGVALTLDGSATVKIVDNAKVFVDVHTVNHWAEDAVDFASARGITGGTSDTTFSPDASCTRAQIVTFLWRAAGSPEPKNTGSFTDVFADSYYAKAVAWAVENGITGGTGDGKFSPDATCTREQTVTFLYRASGNPAVSGGSAFSDVAENAYYANAVAWAEKNEITSGIGGGLFGSGNNCTRGQVVTFLYRFMAK